MARADKLAGRRTKVALCAGVFRERVSVLHAGCIATELLLVAGAAGRGDANWPVVGQSTRSVVAHSARFAGCRRNAADLVGARNWNCVVVTPTILAESLERVPVIAVYLVVRHRVPGMFRGAHLRSLAKRAKALGGGRRSPGEPEHGVCFLDRAASHRGLPHPQAICPCGAAAAYGRA